MNTFSEYSRRYAYGPERFHIDAEESVALVRLMGQVLRDREFAILVDVFWHGLNYEQCSDVLGCTRSRCHQIAAKAIKKFRHPRWMKRLRKELNTDRIQHVGFDSWIR